MYVYVLDYCQCSIHEIEVDKEDTGNIEEILHDYGIDLDTCAYMYSEDKLNIEVLTKNK